MPRVGPAGRGSCSKGLLVDGFLSRGCGNRQTGLRTRVLRLGSRLGGLPLGDVTASGRGTGSTDLGREGLLVRRLGRGRRRVSLLRGVSGDCGSKGVGRTLGSCGACALSGPRFTRSGTLSPGTAAR